MPLVYQWHISSKAKPETMSTPSLRRQAYDHLQRKILSGDLRAGMVVSEQSIASEIGMSRTPVREAIRDLEQEGVLEQVPRYGTIVKELQRRDLAELYELREALEPYAVAQAAGRLPVEELAKLKRFCDEIAVLIKELNDTRRHALDAAQMRRLLSADLGFHLVLLRAAGNRRLMKIVTDSRLLTGVFGTPRQEHTGEVLQETLDYHTQILKAVESGNQDRARKLMAEHIRLSRQQSLEHYDRLHNESDTRTISLGLPGDLLEELNRIESGDGEKPAARKPRRRAA